MDPFEAGALSKNLEQSRVCTLMFGVDNADLSGPLTTFQSTMFEKAEFRKMMLSVNEAGGPNKLPSDTFERVFEHWWPNLECKINMILSSDENRHALETRSDRELLEEILELGRMSALQRHNTIATRNVPSGLIIDLVSATRQTIRENEKFQNLEIRDACEKMIKAIIYLSREYKGGEMFEDEIHALKSENETILPF